MFFLLLLLLPGVRSQVPTASSLLGPGNYQRLPFNTVQFVQPKPTKKGPILFPNDAPPPPPPPLIVTSRPLSESIARSELNPNNSLAAQSQRYQVTFKPEFLARSKNYRPFSYALATATPVYNFGQQSFANDLYPVKNQKDSYYNDYEKRLMESIHGRRDGVNRERTLWEQPIQRRKIDQKPPRRNARKTIFHDDVNSMEIKVYHRSLYSREVNDDVDDDVDNKDFDVVFRRSSNGDSKQRIPIHRSKYQNYYNDRKKYRRLYVSGENDKKPKTRPIYNLNNLNANDDVRQQIPVTEHVQEDYEKFRKMRPLHSLENLSENEDTILKQRTLQNLNEDTSKIQRRPLREIKHTSEENIKKIHRKRTSHRLGEQSDGKEIILKRKPLHSLEYVSDNNERVAYEHSHSAEYNTENHGQDKIPPRKKHKSNIHHRRPTHSADSEEIVQKRPVYSPDSHSHSEDSEETNQQRSVQPLYSFADRDQEQKIAPKPSHYKYQQRFKTLKRKDRQPKNTNYYNAHDGEHDTSKEYNHGENYAFSYTVKDHKTGDDFSHSQQSTGSATNGEYRVRLPDGRMQIVSYTADENGYKADVKYDDQQEHDNSIDVDTSKENRYRNNDLPKSYKHNEGVAYHDHFDSRDTSDREYLSHDHKGDISPSYINEYSKRPTVYTNHQEFNTKNDYVNPNHFVHKTDFTDATKVTEDDLKSGELTENNNDYLDHYNDKNVDSNDNVLRTQNDDYFQFTDELPLSKDILDYSAEFSHGYEPHRSKYSSFKHHNSAKSTVRPSYEELKDLFVTNAHGRRQASLPLVSTAAPHYDTTTENVVVISPKKTNLYTNIRNIAVPVTSTPLPYSTPFAATPSGYLLSTIANLKNKVNLENKPVLSHAYINKINKYLSYK